MLQPEEAPAQEPGVAEVIAPPEAPAAKPTAKAPVKGYAPGLQAPVSMADTIESPANVFNASFEGTLPAEASLTPREKPGIWSTAPRPDIGYMLSSLGAAMAPERAPQLKKLGEVGVQLSQQKAYSGYMSDIIEGIEPDKRALNILTPEQRLSAVQAGQQQKQQKFEMAKAELDEKRKDFKLKQEMVEFDRRMELEHKALGVSERIAKGRVAGAKEVEEIRGRTDIEVQEMKDKAAKVQRGLKEPMTRTEAMMEAGKLAGTGFYQQEDFVFYMRQFGFPISEEEAAQVRGGAGAEAETDDPLGRAIKKAKE